MKHSSMFSVSLMFLGLLLGSVGIRAAEFYYQLKSGSEFGANIPVKIYVGKSGFLEKIQYMMI